ncbi:Pls/PosA family non-ribosomal peptide synthetase [Streptomyces sp. NBC_01320]|uniref:Pls/PosA family non-ribosomal peptide synthetase n=1 Tax=Streptomyces sp. NBC_01320 TaxID=2903824 RepID=UPI002E15B2EE|nr:amino acid adenylation domain-containing protein [Streptomyces sp. NBC_01320]WSK00898.1 amino acid adenylation domain-containing protein [Streptomyces sp. NBC_01320]
MTGQRELPPPDEACAAVQDGPPEASSQFWSDVRLLNECFERACDRGPECTAVECGAERLSYAELDRQANRLARLLLARGVGPGDGVGILLDRSLDSYVALLGVIKSGASYVPLDPAFPADRLEFIVRDAGLRDFVTSSSLSDRTLHLPCAVLEVDRVVDRLAALPAGRPGVEIAPSSPCYVIYTSGTTGRPKGVVVSHASIVNFLRVVTPFYRVTGRDRVYQGLSIAFDFALEEIWPAWIAGATLVAGPAGGRIAGPDLTAFLAERGITVLCCVPTLLATLEPELPRLRTLLLSGEACPADLVRRWWRPNVRILNAYGPTETTVTASCSEPVPHRPVTIGAPLPTYRLYILDESLRAVPTGEPGEICIGGPGVAIGYVNRPALTAERFVPNPVARDRAAAPRVYRTGDRGRRTTTGEIEYLGRVDTQVKIRGYRIELAEIEEVLREDDAVENAVVTPLERDGSAQDLVGYVTLAAAPDTVSEADLRERLRIRLQGRLPGYMVPAHLEVLSAFPLLAADKVDRAALPAPISPPLTRRSRPRAAPATPLEQRLAGLWSDVLGCDGISVTEDFFCDLGGHSMTAARLVSRMRQDPQLRDVAMGDLYAHPTLRGLASCIEALATEPQAGPPATTEAAPAPLNHSTTRVMVCGVAQLAGLYAWLFLPGLAMTVLFYRLFRSGHTRVPASTAGVLDHLVRLPVPAITLLEIGWLAITLLVLPLPVSRLLMAGVGPGRYPLWGVTYWRFWMQSKVLALTPLRLLAGSPLLAVCLRLLGAQIGSHCHLQAMLAPPSLLRIGAGTSIGYGARLQTYTVESGRLRLGTIRIGSGCFVGTNSVVLPGAVIGDGASVGEQSLVPEDCVVPPGEHWAGSPATRQDTVPALLRDLEARADHEPWPARVLAGYGAGALLLVLGPMVIFGSASALVEYTAWRYGLVWALAAAAAAGPLVPLATCLFALVTKRIVMPAAPHAGIHHERSAFGVRKWISDGLMLISLTMTQALYSTLYLVPFLRAMGARTGRWAEVATVNFVDPDMLVVGEGSFLADVSVVGPAIFHRGRIALAPAQIGRRSFVGNGALVPGSCRLGDNSLLGVHSLAPTRPMDPETTWLGSPAIFLPRREASQAFPAKLTYTPSRGLVAARLAIEYFRITLPATVSALSVLGVLFAALHMVGSLSPAVVVILGPALLLGAGLGCTVAAVAVKWAVVGPYRPRVEPLWSIWVRRTELVTGLYENLVVPVMVSLLTGTPWMGTVMRMFGARIGRRVWIATTFMTEFDLVHVGDDAAVGEFTSLQTHLFEDRVMKMDRVTVDDGASIGLRSVVLYDARVGAGARLDALSLVMKGECLPDGTRWRGIPAAPRHDRASTTSTAQDRDPGPGLPSQLSAFSQGGPS